MYDEGIKGGRLAFLCEYCGLLGWIICFRRDELTKVNWHEK